MASKSIHGKSGILNVASKRAHLVERGTEGHYAVTGNHAIRRLHGNRAAEAARLTDGATRVGAQSKRCKTGSHRSRRAARRAAGYTLQIPGVEGTTECRSFRGRTEGKFVHVELAQRNATSFDDLAYARCGIGRNVIFQHAGRAGGVGAFQVHVVLKGNGHARQRASLGNIARSDGGINTCRRGQGRFFSGFEESMYRLVGRYDTCQGVFCNFLGAEFFGSKACLDLSY